MSSTEISLQKIPAKTMSELMANTDEHVLNALRNSIYPGAKDESIAMVLAYCKSKKYDPLAKVCHIVPMNVKDSKTGKYDWRDVILPGIAGYRIDAHRTGLYVGLSEPEFGPMIKENLGGKNVTYPEWCKVTVKKMMQGGFIAEFTSTEYWKENYATKGKDSIEPNVMWEKRGKGQLAKCAEAQGLRKAFPEAVGNLPTFEEMEGKELKNVIEDKLLLDNNSIIDKDSLSVLRDKIKEADSKEIDICNHLKLGCLDEMNMGQWQMICKMLNVKISKKRKTEELDINKLLADEPTEDGYLTSDIKGLD